MKFGSFITVLFITINSCFAQLSSPESVDFHHSTNTYFVASTSNSRILKINPQTSATTLFANVTSPYGIEVAGDTLFVCTSGTVKGFDVNTGAQVFNLNLSGSFLNGITHDNAGNLYVTDFSAKKIFKITRGTTPAFTTLVANTTDTPNGIIYDAMNNRLLYVTWGTNAKIKAINLDGTPLPNVLNSTNSNIDGIALDNQNNIFISMWGGQKVLQYNPSATTILTTINTGIGNPADIYYNKYSDTLAIPNTSLNTVKFVGFTPNTTGVESPSDVEINVYPNPFTDFIKIVFFESKNETSCKVLNSQGKIIYESSTAKQIIPTHSWSKGVYIVYVNNRRYTLVKQ